MSKLVENILWASAGAALGYVLAKRHLETEFQLRLDGQIENADEFYRLKYEKKLAAAIDELDEVHDIKVFVEEIPVEDSPEVHSDEKISYGGLTSPGVTEALRNYQGMFKGAKTPEVVEVTREVSIPGEQSPVQSQPEKPSPDRQVIISEEAFFENQKNFKQVSMIYYAGDDQLATSEHHVVSHNIRLNSLGSEVMEKLKMGLDGDAEVIYVRNKELGVEYEIFREHSMYTEAVGPIGSVE